MRDYEDLGRMDETFMDLTLEDIKENILTFAKSRAKRKPKPLVTLVSTPFRTIRITVEVV